MPSIKNVQLYIARESSLDINSILRIDILKNKDQMAYNFLVVVNTNLKQF